MYGDGYATHRSSGLPELEARQKALDPALRAGLITAAVTYAGGPRGVEAFFRQAEGRELVKRTLWENVRTGQPMALGVPIHLEILKHRELLGYECSFVGEALSGRLPALSTSHCGQRLSS